MTRIAFISAMDGSPWGGSEVLWSESAKRLLAQRHAVLACVAMWPEIPAPLVDLRQQGAILERRPQPSASLVRRGWNWLGRKILKMSRGDSSWKRIQEFRPDLVCISHGGTICGLEWMLRCLDSNIPYVSIAQVNNEYMAPGDDRAELIRRAYRGCVQPYFVSRRNQQLFETHIGEPLPRAEVVLNPFSVSYDAAPQWPDDTGTLKLACVGRLDIKAKGQDLIVEVLSFAKWRQRSVQVTLFGSGPYADNLRRLVAWRKLESTVTFAGHVSDIEAIWRTHHALLLPSRFEGLPLALVEAMLCGRFGIVTDVAGNTEVVADNVNGFVAAWPAAAQLDEAMERAWQRRSEWEGIGRTAARSIREHAPRDPAAMFAEKLLGIVRSGGS